MRLTQIRDFIAVVECGGVRAAARKLGVSQPTITKSVRS
ncbi:MAG TPA: LysR family transcriptional regulator, partial [Burkholderiaceae bacterium]|nr:LysR family transcriptional regulator [Burkholderiaceae bacterium]